MKKTALLIITIFMLVYSSASCQTGIGATLGGGYISGDSPNITSLNLSLFMDIDAGFSNIFVPRVSFLYGVDFEKVVPGSRQNYYPFIKGLSLKGIINQQYPGDYFLEEGVGIIYLNDRTFSTTDNWNSGVVFSLSGGIDFSDINKKGFLLGIGAEYAFTFGGTFPKYFTLSLQSKYLL